MGGPFDTPFGKSSGDMLRSPFTIPTEPQNPGAETPAIELVDELGNFIVDEFGNYIVG